MGLSSACPPTVPLWRHRASSSNSPRCTSQKQQHPSSISTIFHLASCHSLTSVFPKTDRCQTIPPLLSLDIYNGAFIITCLLSTSASPKLQPSQDLCFGLHCTSLCSPSFQPCSRQGKDYGDSGSCPADVLSKAPDTAANMESVRGLGGPRRGNSPSKHQQSTPESAEHLLEAFKAAALSVTKLYKSSAAAEQGARHLGYQDCLDDLLAFLDKRGLGLNDGEGWEIRRWATERLDGRDAVTATVDSDDDGERAEEVLSSPEMHRISPPTTLILPEEPMRTGSAPPTAASIAEAPPTNVPTQDDFTFQSALPYPQDTSLNISGLALSDSRTADSITSHGASGTPSSRRSRHGGNARSGSRSWLGRGAGQKRRFNISEYFDVSGMGYGKDVFGNGAKRGRHV